MMKPSDRVFVAGHRGLVGSTIYRMLQERGYSHLIVRTHEELDLTNQDAVLKFFSQEKPDVVIVAAAKVGGILANNTQRADFIRDNLLIQTNLIDQAHKHGVKRLMFLGSSCIYPRDCPQPIKEDYLLTGPLELTNEPYAIAKIAGIKLCDSINHQHGTKYVSVMPTNLYGPNDNFDLQTSHVLPALIRRFHEAKEKKADSVTIWGTGKPKREFLYVDDMADACIYLLEKTETCDLLNIGTGKDIAIGELAEIVKEVVGYQGKIDYDTSKPDGTPRKLLDVSRLKSLGWEAKTGLKEGIKKTYEAFLDGHVHKM
eukprot:Rmarinus@m.22265